MEKLYTVERKEEVRRYDSKSQEIITDIRVWATSKGGTYFHIDIPETLIKTDDAIKMINEKSQAIDSL